LALVRDTTRGSDRGGRVGVKVAASFVVDVVVVAAQERRHHPGKRSPGDR